MMCDVLKSSKRGIRFPFKTRTPLLSLLQILAFEANNILIMKQIKQLPLCYPLSGFTTLIISNSLWCWCLPKKPFPAHPWPTTADLKKPGLSQRRFSSSVPHLPWHGRAHNYHRCHLWSLDSGSLGGDTGRTFYCPLCLLCRAWPSSATNFLLDIEKIGCFQALSSRHCLGPRSNVPSDTNFAGLLVSSQRFPYLSLWCWNIKLSPLLCLSSLNQGTVGLSPRPLWWPAPAEQQTGDILH